MGSLHGRLEDKCIGPYSLLWGGLDAGVRVTAVIVHLPHSFDIAAAAHPPTGDLLVLLSRVSAPIILGYLWMMTHYDFHSTLPGRCSCMLEEKQHCKWGQHLDSSWASPQSFSVALFLIICTSLLLSTDGRNKEPSRSRIKVKFAPVIKDVGICLWNFFHYWIMHHLSML